MFQPDVYRISYHIQYLDYHYRVGDVSYIGFVITYI